MFPLPIRVRIALGADLTAAPSSWTWTDITDYARKKIAITRGKPDEASQAPPMSCRLRVNNAGGRFVARNPLGEWYPLLRRNTPLRVEVQVSGVWHVRFTGFIDELPPTFVPGSTDTYVDLVASGVTRRLGQGSAPVQSAPARYIPTTNPVAYWPLEDGQLTSEGAPLVGTQSMRPFVGTHPSGSVITVAQWGRGDLAPWLPGAVSRTGSAGLTAIWATVTMPATVTRWAVDFMYRSGTDAADSTVDVNPSYLGGSLGWPQLLLLPSVRGVDVSMNGEPEVSGTSDRLFDGQAHHVRWDVTQSGSKVAWTVYVDGGVFNSGTTSGNMTLPPVQTLSLVASAQAGADMVQGHVAVWTTPPTLTNAVAAAFGHRGESAAARITRLCAEAGIAFAGAGTGSEGMGPQSPAPLLQLMREAETTDGGILYERADGRLAYLLRSERYNRPVSLALTYGQLAGVFEPADDDRAVRNDVTASRPSGRSARVVDQAHIDAQGRYDVQVTVNTLADAPLADHAGWRVHLGTVDELRYPRLTLNLGNAQVDGAAVAAWLSADIGTRMTVSGPPSELAVQQIDQVIEGYTETIDRVEWSAVLNCSPAAGWDVATADGPQRAAADGSLLASALSSSAMSVPLWSTLANGLWTQDPADFPLDLRVGGEVVTSPKSGPINDTFTRTTSGGWGGTWSVVMSSGSAFSTDGNRAVIGLTGTGRHGAVVDLGSADQDMLISIRSTVVATGASILHGWMARYTDTDNHLYVEAQMRTDGRIWLGLYARFQGVNTTLVAPVNIMAYTAGTTYRLAVRTVGEDFQARVYPGGTPPPFQVSAVAPQTIRGTRAGARALLVGGNTNPSPVEITYDNVEGAGAGIGPGAYDGFNRTVTGSFGTAPTGQVWSHLGSSSAFRVASGSGWHLHTAIDTGRHSLIDIGTGNSTFQFAVAAPVMSLGMPLTAYAVARPNPSSPTNDQYHVRIAFLVDGRVTCTVRKREGGVPDSKSNVALDGPYSPGQFWFVKISVEGAWVRGKVWPASQAEPGGWMTAWMDPSPLPESWTQIGVTTLTEPGSTNTHPVEFPITAFQVLNPQAVTVSARGVTGVQRAWPAGTDIDVRPPAVAAL
ncbi:hypothetical protein [Micromonospora sp. NBRC 107095]|uniref:hypothetical protein n=1 Tax=Micromonospora sp. NBRC 107095 TaxID=3032209 RepID=UPI0024A0D692|nr:hypothetical protein [Micromonospora sp. NBRC 107095]GLZ62883.1 hypothetical protein Misp05_64590 [Micromonospora sp. NBRC 107095]